jgi:hypothetical protein
MATMAEIAADLTGNFMQIDGRSLRPIATP